MILLGMFEDDCSIGYEKIVSIDAFECEHAFHLGAS
jgi:hypothetical protein